MQQEMCDQSGSRTNGTQSRTRASINTRSRKIQTGLGLQANPLVVRLRAMHCPHAYRGYARDSGNDFLHPGKCCASNSVKPVSRECKITNITNTIKDQQMCFQMTTGGLLGTDQRHVLAEWSMWRRGRGSRSRGGSRSWSRASCRVVDTIAGLCIVPHLLAGLAGHRPCVHPAPTGKAQQCLLTVIAVAGAPSCNTDGYAKSRAHVREMDSQA